MKLVIILGYSDGSFCPMVHYKKEVAELETVVSKLRTENQKLKEENEELKKRISEMEASKNK